VLVSGTAGDSILALRPTTLRVFVATAMSATAAATSMTAAAHHDRHTYAERQLKPIL